MGTILIESMAKVLEIEESIRDSIKVIYKKSDLESFSAIYNIDDKLITKTLWDFHQLAINERLNEEIIENKQSDPTDFLTTLDLECCLCNEGFTDTGFIKNENCIHKFCEKCSEKLHPENDE